MKIELIIALVVLFLPLGLWADEGDADVVLLWSHDGDREADALLDSVRASLSDLELDARSQQVLTVNETIAAQISAFAVIWVDLDEQKIYLLITRDGQSHLNSRDLPTDKESNTNWEMLCDAMASMVRSMLIPWFESREVTNIEKAKAPIKNESEPKEEVVEQPPVTTDSFFEVGFGAGYSPIVMSRRNPFLNGLHLDAQIYFGRYFGVSAGVDVLERIQNSIGERKFTLARFPIRIGAIGKFVIKRLELGGSLSLVLDLTRVKGAPPKITNVVYAGLSPALFVGFRAAKWLRFDMVLGSDFYFNSNDYVYDGQTAFAYGPVQPRLFAGATFFVFRR